MLKPTKQAQVTKEFRRNKLQILGLSEIRLADSGERRCSTGEPQDQIRTYGVGFMLSKSAYESLMDWHPISEIIILARFKTKGKYVAFIQVYAPTEVASAEDKEEFYGKLAYTLNAKVGNSNEGELFARMGNCLRERGTVCGILHRTQFSDWWYALSSQRHPQSHIGIA